jgi:integrase
MGRRPDAHYRLFSDAADEYLKVAKRHLAACTYDDTHGLLKAGGIVSRHFDDVFVEEIDKAKLAAFWKAAVTDRKRAAKTGRNYLNAISAVLSLCVDEGIIDINPVSAFRRSATVQTGSRTKRARQADQAGSKARPIETGESVAALVSAADAYRHEGSRITKIRGKTVEASLRETEKLSRQKAYVCVMLLLDAGLRLGEAIALRWKDVVFDAADGRLIVRKSFSRGKHMGAPKSGREREVELSSRLRSVLVEWRNACGPVDDDNRIVDLDSGNFRNRHFEPIVKLAGLPLVEGRLCRPKDLRDTYASHLLSANIPLPYVSKQLGHGDVLTTARHYARWIDASGRYVAPPVLQVGEVPADLLARLGKRSESVARDRARRLKVVREPKGRATRLK